MHLSWLLQLPTLQKSRATKEEGTSIEGLHRSDCPIGMSVEHFLDAGLCRRVQPTVVGAIPGQVSLD